MAHTRIFAAFLLLRSVVAVAQSAPSRSVPARTIPTPSTISPQMQKRSAAIWQGSTGTVTKTSDQWKSWIKEMDVYKLNEAASLQKQFRVTVEDKKLSGVQVYVIKPEHILPQNQKRLLVHVHGGGYIFFGGMAATTEAILIAHYTGTEVISIDYRMPPDYPFPAAVDDASLLVFEAQSHGQYLEEDTPECAIALGEVARFFDHNLSF